MATLRELLVRGIDTLTSKVDGPSWPSPELGQLAWLCVHYQVSATGWTQHAGIAQHT